MISRHLVAIRRRRLPIYKSCITAVAAAACWPGFLIRGVIAGVLRAHRPASTPAETGGHETTPAGRADRGAGHGRAAGACAGLAGHGSAGRVSGRQPAPAEARRGPDPVGDLCRQPALVGRRRVKRGGPERSAITALVAHMSGERLGLALPQRYLQGGEPGP